MTEEQRIELVENPEGFLLRCRYHEQNIKLKLEQIRHYRELAESITAEIKEVTTFSLMPSNKIENCAIELVTLQEEIQQEVQDLRADLVVVQEAIGLVDNEIQKNLLEARFIQHLTWEEISVLLDCSYRWTLRLYKRALKKISQQAMLIHIEPAI